MGAWMSDQQNHEEPQGQDGPADGKKVKKPGEALVGKTLFDRYQVLEVLGESAMALVLKAQEIDSGRMVAIKTVTPHEPDVVQRFAQEVQLHSKLKHKNIVEAIDCLEASSGRTFFIMEYLLGTSLLKVLKNQKKITNETELAVILIQICDALGHAHAFGVLHRDLKPGNIFLMESEGNMAVKVLDFGIAKPLGQQTGLTQAGYAVGSPLYMSPEQCRGQAVDMRSDVYSLGILAYEMATGDLPYPGHNLMTVMAAHCDPQKKPAPLSKNVPELRRVDELNSIIQMAMETDPLKRFQSIGDFRKAIEQWYQSIQTASLASAQGPFSPGVAEVAEAPLVAAKVPDDGGWSSAARMGVSPQATPQDIRLKVRDEEKEKEKEKKIEIEKEEEEDDNDDYAPSEPAREPRRQLQSDVSDQRNQLRTRLSVSPADTGSSNKSKTMIIVVVLLITALALALLMMGGLLLNK